MQLSWVQVPWFGVNETIDFFKEKGAFCSTFFFVLFCEIICIK